MQRRVGVRALLLEPTLDEIRTPAERQRHVRHSHDPVNPLAE
jgi:hypothetical protein